MKNVTPVEDISSVLEKSKNTSNVFSITRLKVKPQNQSLFEAINQQNNCYIAEII